MGITEERKIYNYNFLAYNHQIKEKKLYNTKKKKNIISSSLPISLESSE